VPSAKEPEAEAVEQAPPAQPSPAPGSPAEPSGAPDASPSADPVRASEAPSSSSPIADDTGTAEEADAAEPPWVRLRKLLPRRTRTRVALVALLALIVAGAMIGAFVLRGGGPQSFYGPEVTFKRLPGATSTGTGNINQYDWDPEADNFDLSLEIVGNRSDRYELLLFDELAATKKFAELPNGARRILGPLVASYEGGAREGYIYEFLDLPPDYRDFKYIGVARQPAGETERRLDLYAAVAKFTAGVPHR